MTDWQIEDDFKEPYALWKKAPGPDTSGALLTAVDPVLESAVRTFGQGAEGPLLKSRARRIALDAMPGYDPAQGRLRPFLNSHLQGLRRIATRQTQPIRLPERILLDQAHLHETTGRLRDELGREPDDVELADASRLSVRRIARIRQARPPVAEGQLVAPGESGGLESIDPEVRLPGGSDAALLDFVHQSLAPADRFVLEHALGLYGKPRLDNLTLARRLRVSPAAVSQRKARIQARVNTLLGAGVFR